MMNDNNSNIPIHLIAAAIADIGDISLSESCLQYISLDLNNTSLSSSSSSSSSSNQQIQQYHHEPLYRWTRRDGLIDYIICVSVADYVRPSKILLVCSLLKC